MARIIEYIPQPESYEICSYCRERIKIVTKVDFDEEYKACGYCGEYLENA